MDYGVEDMRGAGETDADEWVVPKKVNSKYTKRELFTASMFLVALVGILVLGFWHRWIHTTLAVFFTLLIGPFPLAIVLGGTYESKDCESPAETGVWGRDSTGERQKVHQGREDNLSHAWPESVPPRKTDFKSYEVSRDQSPSNN